MHYFTLQAFALDEWTDQGKMSKAQILIIQKLDLILFKKLIQFSRLITLWLCIKLSTRQTIPAKTKIMTKYLNQKWNLQILFSFNVRSSLLLRIKKLCTLFFLLLLSYLFLYVTCYQKILMIIILRVGLWYISMKNFTLQHHDFISKAKIKSCFQRK